MKGEIGEDSEGAVAGELAEDFFDVGDSALSTVESQQFVLFQFDCLMDESFNAPGRAARNCFSCFFPNYNGALPRFGQPHPLAPMMKVSFKIQLGICMPPPNAEAK